MLIVATQDDYFGEQFAIFDTIEDRFIGVNLSKEEAVITYLNFRGGSYQEALYRVEHAQPFKDICDAIE